MGIEKSKRKKALRNRTAITVHTSSAVAVQRVIAQLTNQLCSPRKGREIDAQCGVEFRRSVVQSVLQ